MKSIVTSVEEKSSLRGSRGGGGVVAYQLWLVR
jgi:hypothetical protein